MVKHLSSSLNPCFNGRCTRTLVLGIIECASVDSLNPCFNGRCTRTAIKLFESFIEASLNPCFNGRCTRTNKKRNNEKVYDES